MYIYIICTGLGALETCLTDLATLAVAFIRVAIQLCVLGSNEIA